jgi:hypothetical protein
VVVVGGELIIIIIEDQKKVREFHLYSIHMLQTQWMTRRLEKEAQPSKQESFERELCSKTFHRTRLHTR